jgi:hypothetical protein
MSYRMKLGIIGVSSTELVPILTDHNLLHAEVAVLLQRGELERAAKMAALSVGEVEVTNYLAGSLDPLTSLPWSSRSR